MSKQKETRRAESVQAERHGERSKPAPNGLYQHFKGNTAHQQRYGIRAWLIQTRRGRS